MSDFRFEFDQGLAERFVPREGLLKHAILVPMSADTITTIEAPFGPQQMVGSFYVVADEAGSYGVAKREFEQTHESVGDHRWRKIGGVLALQSPSAGQVRTVLANGHVEVEIRVDAGDWVVQAESGELYAMTASAFKRRYRRAD